MKKKCVSYLVELSILRIIDSDPRSNNAKGKKCGCFSSQNLGMTAIFFEDPHFFQRFAK